MQRLGIIMPKKNASTTRLPLDFLQAFPKISNKWLNSRRDVFKIIILCRNKLLSPWRIKSPNMAQREISDSNNLQNNEKLHIYSWACPLINWQNIKGNKRGEKAGGKLINLAEHLLITGCINITRKERITLHSAHCPHFPQHLVRLIISHQLLTQLSSKPLHMLMNQPRDETRNCSCPPNRAGVKSTRQKRCCVVILSRRGKQLTKIKNHIQALLTFSCSANEFIMLLLFNTGVIPTLLLLLLHHQISALSFHSQSKWRLF